MCGRTLSAIADEAEGPPLVVLSGVECHPPPLPFMHEFRGLEAGISVTL